MENPKNILLDHILKKYNLINTDRIEIPNVGRNDLANYLHEINIKTGVEVGVERGIYSEVLLKANPQIKMWGVDPWESIETCKSNLQNRKTQNHRSQRLCDRIYKCAVGRLSLYPNYTIIKAYSCDAVKMFDDESLDFVYIDANHEYSFVIEDINLWSRKIRIGGIISGHDYVNTCKTSRYKLIVKKAVDDYVLENNIKPLTIWGAHAKIPGIIRDNSRSWMFFKT